MTSLAFQWNGIFTATIACLSNRVLRFGKLGKTLLARNVDIVTCPTISLKTGFLLTRWKDFKNNG